MKHLEFINELKSIFQNVKGLNVALLYGSFGRGDANYNSDIDIQILVDNKFDKENFIKLLENKFNSDELLSVIKVNIKDKIVLYFKDYPKIEFQICRIFEDINKYYLGSEITNLDETVIYSKNKYWDLKIKKYLYRINSENKNHNNAENLGLYDLIDKFIYEFENCSDMHRRGDAYRFYFFYNAAFDAAIKIKYILNGKKRFKFLPKFINRNLFANTVELENFYQLNGTLFLQEGNYKKRKLLDFFFNMIDNKIDLEKIRKIRNILESIYKRDYLWNFRDISKFNNLIKKGYIYRSATLSIHSDFQYVSKILNDLNIKTIIDLRAEKEINESPYDINILSNDLKINYHNISFDPWNQPEWFRRKYNSGSNDEIAYKFFIIGCKEQYFRLFEILSNVNNYPLIIHCFAGRDRTGIVITILHLLVNSSYDIIKKDYLGSDEISEKDCLNIVIDYINELGGVHKFLLNCGISEQKIQKVKQIISYVN
jgi:protein tyrosine/serine phosphatase/predicted nucleotidyltransferase